MPQLHIIRIGLLLLVLLLLTTCGAPARTHTPPTPVPSAGIVSWLEQTVDADNPQTRVSGVVVRIQQPTSDGVVLLYSYDRNRQGFREAMTCVQDLRHHMQTWESAYQEDCISTFPDDPTPLPPLATNGYSQRQDKQGQPYTLSFGFATQPTAQRIKVRLRDGTEHTTAVVRGSFLLLLLTKSTVSRMEVLDTNGVVLAQQQFQ